MRKSFDITVLATYFGLIFLSSAGCIAYDQEGVTSKQIGDEVSLEVVQDASSRAPTCDALNQTTVYFDEETGIFITCDSGAWEHIDLEARMQKSLGTHSYYWTPYNDYDMSVYVNCGSLSGGKPGVISGVQSQHDDFYEDRRFSYKCSFIYDY